MRTDTPWSRLCVSVLTLLLAGAGAQVLNWTPDIRADVPVSSTAALVPAPGMPTGATMDTLDLSWDNSIEASGVYVLAQDLSGTEGYGVVILSDNVILRGKGHSITGDGSTESEGESEGGVFLGPHSNVSVTGIELHDLDTGVAVEGTAGKTYQNVTLATISFDNNKRGGSWYNYGSVQNVTVSQNHFVNNNIGLYWHAEPGSSAKEILFDDNFVQSTDLYGFLWSASGGTVDTIVFRDNSIEDNDLYGVAYYSDGPDSLGDLHFIGNHVHGSRYGVTLDNRGVGSDCRFSGNQFSQVRYGVRVDNRSTIDALVGVEIVNNTFDGAGIGVRVTNEADMANVNVKGNEFTNGDSPYSMPPALPTGQISFFGGGKGIQVSGNTIQGGTDMSGIRLAGGYMGEQPVPFYDVSIVNNQIQNLSGDDGSGPASGIHFFNLGADGVHLAAPLSADGSTTPTIVLNSFIDNAGPGVAYTKGYSNPLPAIDVGNNWWGDPAGPDGPSGDGVGDDVVVTTWMDGPPREVYLPLVNR